MNGPHFKEKDLALLIDRKGRKQVIQLQKGESFHTHIGIVSHDKILETGVGGEVSSSEGALFTVLSPTLTDYIYEMPRGPQIIYPKDLGHMLFWADIYPGVKVFESGVGSGAMSLALLRAGAKVTGYEIRADHIEQAMKNIQGFTDSQELLKNYDVYEKNCYEKIEESGFDRMVLDLPEPWQAIPNSLEALNPGGILLAYTPSITQAARLAEALDKKHFTEPETLEILNRSWHIAGQSVRPDHRMVAHTGFLTLSKRLLPK